MDDGTDGVKLASHAHDLLRTSQQAHYTLSQMGDNKASILMAATFVTFTITVGQSRNGEGPPLALVVLGAFAFVSAVLTVLAVLPAIKPPKGGRLNLLFFGSFAQLEEEDYLERLMAVLQTDESVFRTMATDMYQNGLVLARKKYRLLGYAYHVFLCGMTASLLTFIATHYL